MVRLSVFTFETRLHPILIGILGSRDGRRVHARERDYRRHPRGEAPEIDHGFVRYPETATEQGHGATAV